MAYDNNIQIFFIKLKKMQFNLVFSYNHLISLLNYSSCNNHIILYFCVMTLTQYPPLTDIYIRRANRNDNLIHSLGIIVVRSEFFIIL